MREASAVSPIDYLGGSGIRDSRNNSDIWINRLKFHVKPCGSESLRIPLHAGGFVIESVMIQTDWRLRMTFEVIKAMRKKSR